MRRAALLALLVIALPIATWANSQNTAFSNSDSRMTAGGSTLTLSNSTRYSSNAFGQTTQTSGSVGITTGKLMSGKIGTSTALATGGTGNNGLLFAGTFSGPLHWVGNFNPARNRGKSAWTYTLTSTAIGKLVNSTNASAGTLQYTFDVPAGEQFSKWVNLEGGMTSVTVPEPGTLGLLGTGLLGIAGLIRRKMKTPRA